MGTGGGATLTAEKLLTALTLIHTSFNIANGKGLPPQKHFVYLSSKHAK
jgi:hypothetical protein